MTFNEFLVMAYGYHDAELRQGQHMINELSRVRPDLYKTVSGASLDPYYDNKKIDAFINWLGQNWSN